MDSRFTEINASAAGTKELKELIDNARLRFFGLEKKTTYVYIDEFHRWNKLQQDSLLKALEEGVIRFIGSTTENPYFAVNNAVLSRVRNIYEFKRLSRKDVLTLLQRALSDREKGFGNLHVSCEESALELLAELSGGDGRVALDTLGFIVDNLDLTQKLTQKKWGKPCSVRSVFITGETIATICCLPCRNPSGGAIRTRRFTILPDS